MYAAGSRSMLSLGMHVDVDTNSSFLSITVTCLISSLAEWRDRQIQAGASCIIPIILTQTYSFQVSSAQFSSKPEANPPQIQLLSHDIRETPPSGWELSQHPIRAREEVLHCWWCQLSNTQANLRLNFPGTTDPLAIWTVYLHCHDQWHKREN